MIKIILIKEHNNHTKQQEIFANDIIIKHGELIYFQLEQHHIKLSDWDIIEISDK